MELVAGGGDDPGGTTAENVRLDGYAADLAVSDGVVYLLADSVDSERRLLTVEGDGAVSSVELADGARFVAAGPDGVVYVASDDTIYQVEGSSPVPVVATAESDESAADIASADGTIESLAVDGEGRPIWTEVFFGTGPDDWEPLLSRVMRLDGGEVEHVAGASSVEADREQVGQWQISPPDNVPATELPLLADFGVGGAIAADDDAVYLGGLETILRVGPDTMVEVVVGPGERQQPSEPFDDEGDPSDFGGSWSHTSMDVSDGSLVAVDSTFVSQVVDVAPFAWSADLSGRAQNVAEKIVHQPSGADGSFNLDSDRTQYGQLAVVIQDGTAATAMARVSKVAVEGGELYAVGQTRTRDSSYTDDAEMLIVRTELP